MLVSRSVAAVSSGDQLKLCDDENSSFYRQVRARKVTRTSTSSEPSTKRFAREAMPTTENVVAGISELQQEAETWKMQLDEQPLAAELAVSLAQSWIRHAASSSGALSCGLGTTFADRNKSDRLSCLKCGGVLFQVVSLNCGHSFCRKCASTLDHCCKCGKAKRPLELRTNVAVSKLVDKWWAPELRAVQLRNAGNQAFAEQLYDRALEIYQQAFTLAPTDFTLLSNRSNLLAKMAKFDEALKDADQVVRLRPDWPKGHYRRAVALRGLGRQEDALMALLHCVVTERSLLPDVRDDIAKVLSTLMATAAKQTRPAESESSSSEDSSQSSGEEAAHDSIAQIAGSSSAEDDDDETLTRSPEMIMPLSINRQSNSKLHLLFDRIVSDLDRLKKMPMNVAPRTVDTSSEDKIDSADFECTLCCRLLWQPVTTPCGHTFCRTCLDRCMDHTPACPLCKTSLEEYLAERRQSLTEFLDFAMVTYLPNEYAERSRIHDDEMKELASTDNIPIFICTMAYPTVRCPLHVFEPRYRLMIRRCMESGSRQFGMCAYVQDQPHGFAEYGTMLEVSDVEFFTDGRSVVDTVGGRRFRVLRRGVLDGYCTAGVEFLVDQPVDPTRVDALIALHDRVRQDAQNWITSAPAALRQRILQHFGTIPPVEPDWMSLPDGPAWLWWLMAILPLNPKAQIGILSMTQLEKRLEAVQRGVAYVRQRTL